jgi:predicted unusual protein kinase regulating ubiquinone biosynthesis (AarF/ABC1/UbiB family)
VNYANVIPKINEVARKHRMGMPKEFVLIIKQLLYFDRYAKLLAPTLNVFTDPRLVMSMMNDIVKIRQEQNQQA